MLYFYNICFVHFSFWRGPNFLAREFIDVGTSHIALPYMRFKSKKKLPWPWAEPIESRGNMRDSLFKPVSDKAARWRYCQT